MHPNTLDVSKTYKTTHKTIALYIIVSITLLEMPEKYIYRHFRLYFAYSNLFYPT